MAVTKTDAPTSWFSLPHACTPTGAERTRSSVLVFRLAGQQYALTLRDVRELLPMADFARPPMSPAVLAGFLNLGGAAVAVLRLDRLFGLPDQPLGPYAPLVLLRDSCPPVAVAVESVSRIVRLAPGAVLPVRPDDSFNGAVTGTATLDGRLTLLLSAEHILLDKERQILAEFHDREQRRLTALEEALP